MPHSFPGDGQSAWNVGRTPRSAADAPVGLLGLSRRAILSRILLSTKWPGTTTRRDPDRSSRERRFRRVSPVSCRTERRSHRARFVSTRVYVSAVPSIPSRVQSVGSAPAPESRPLTFPDDGHAPHEGVPPRVDSAPHFLARVPSFGRPPSPYRECGRRSSQWANGLGLAWCRALRFTARGGRPGARGWRENRRPGGPRG